MYSCVLFDYTNIPYALDLSVPNLLLFNMSEAKAKAKPIMTFSHARFPRLPSGCMFLLRVPTGLMCYFLVPCDWLRVVTFIDFRFSSVTETPTSMFTGNSVSPT